MTISEELKWVPDLIKGADLEPASRKQTLVSYFLMLQHDMALLKRSVFGACVDNSQAKTCTDLQKTGFIEVQLQFVQVHFNIFGGLSHADTALRPHLGPRLQQLMTEYGKLLWWSLHVFRQHRLPMINYKGSLHQYSRYRGTQKSCKAVIEDKFQTGRDRFKHPGGAGWTLRDDGYHKSCPWAGRTSPHCCRDDGARVTNVAVQHYCHVSGKLDFLKEQICKLTQVCSAPTALLQESANMITRKVRSHANQTLHRLSLDQSLDRKGKSSDSGPPDCAAGPPAPSTPAPTPPPPTPTPPPPPPPLDKSVRGKR